MYTEKWLFKDINGKVFFTQVKHSRNVAQMDDFYARNIKMFDEPNPKFPNRENGSIQREAL